MGERESKHHHKDQPGGCAICWAYLDRSDEIAGDYEARIAALRIEREDLLNSVRGAGYAYERYGKKEGGDFVREVLKKYGAKGLPR